MNFSFKGAGAEVELGVITPTGSKPSFLLLHVLLPTLNWV